VVVDLLIYWYLFRFTFVTKVYMYSAYIFCCFKVLLTGRKTSCDTVIVLCCKMILSELREAPMKQLILNARY